MVYIYKMACKGIGYLVVTVSQARDDIRWKCRQANHTRFKKQKTKRNLIFLKETTYYGTCS